MNYGQARELRDKDGNPSGLWHYTVMNDGRIWAAGYCARDQGCHGHLSEDAAYEHQKQYMLDQRTFYDRQMSGQKMVCEAEGCEEWTQGLVQIGSYQHYVLCDAHRNRETLEQLYSVGPSAYS